MNPDIFKNLVRALFFLTLVSGGINFASAQQLRVSQNDQAPFVRSVDPVDYSDAEWQHRDRNGDGAVDYVVLYNSDGRKIQEVYDIAHDGNLDDFYFYDDGELIQRELDTTHDGKIDVWVELTRGYLVTEIKRDTNGDGEADYVRKYE